MDLMLYPLRELNPLPHHHSSASSSSLLHLLIHQTDLARQLVYGDSESGFSQIHLEKLPSERDRTNQHPSPEDEEAGDVCRKRVLSVSEGQSSLCETLPTLPDSYISHICNEELYTEAIMTTVLSRSPKL